MSGILRDQSSQSDCVSADMCPSGVGKAGNYSTISDVDQALKIPLGSQLQLLTAAYQGDPFFNYTMTGYQLLPPSVGVSSYNSLAGNCSQGNGQYYSFGCAYSTS